MVRLNKQIILAYPLSTRAQSIHIVREFTLI
jgi:hypothetical protein